MRLRLQVKENRLRDLTKKYLFFTNEIEVGNTEELDATYQSLLLDISNYQFQVSKARALVDTNVHQVAEYDAMQQSVEAEMSSTRADIVHLMAVLEKERTIRQQKEQYSALARRVHTYPSRNETQIEIQRLNHEITDLQQESHAVASALELRSKRFAGFMHALHDMQLLLQDDEVAPMLD